MEMEKGEGKIYPHNKKLPVVHPHCDYCLYKILNK